jgi:hypothetical protein
LFWAWAVFEELGVEQEKERKAREKPNRAPSSTRLKMKKFFDDKRWEKFMKTTLLWSSNLKLQDQQNRPAYIPAMRNSLHVSNIIFFLNNSYTIGLFKTPRGSVRISV